jgi:hypothetical protein
MDPFGVGMNSFGVGMDPFGVEMNSFGGGMMADHGAASAVKYAQEVWKNGSIQ